MIITENMPAFTTQITFVQVTVYQRQLELDKPRTSITVWLAICKLKFRIYNVLEKKLNK